MVLTKTTNVIGPILKVFGDCFATNYLFRADSVLSFELRFRSENETIL